MFDRGYVKGPICLLLSEALNSLWAIPNHAVQLHIDWV